jgi:Protein of unknown function DUF262/Protein of unknown function (DUF1524)
VGEEKIQSSDISVADLFKSFYVVPDYQREYVWEDAQVEQLLQDILDEQSSSGSPAEYFIGSIVVCRSKTGPFELIDGQQRMTTLFLVICAIRDHLVQLGNSSLGSISALIHAVDTDLAGRDVPRYRLELQYQDSGDVVVEIASQRGEETAAKEHPTLSMTNLAGAYRCARRFLHQEYKRDEDGLRRFYGYLCKQVKLIRIEAPDMAKALKIFETINDRGVGLNAMDLLKNLLFMKATSDQFEELKKTWKQLQDTLYKIQEKPLRFLRYYIVSHYDVSVLREDKIYDWLAANAVECGYDRDPLGFATELHRAALAYGNFVAGKNAEGVASWQLENLQLLGGKAARQHMILLLAGRALPGPMFDALCSEVESLFFCYIVTRRPTRDFERSFAAWAPQIRNARSMEQLTEVFAATFTRDKQGLAPRFAKALSGMSADDLQAYRLRYLLAKLTQHVELQAYGAGKAQRWLAGYMENQIEHVFPQTPSEETTAEFGPCREASVAQRLGNLVLIEKSINASLGNRPYSEKRKVYPQSKLLLTRALAERPKVGLQTKIDIAVEDLEPFLEWNEVAIVRRQRQLVSLACKVWDVPAPDAVSLFSQDGE